MARPKRNLQSGFCDHITTRCNNYEFRLTRLECREVKADLQIQSLRKRDAYGGLRLRAYL
ncbi:MAG: hypothetical protein V7K14_08800 [Nostoc sp.]|uniref:hypothetical protein n=1 Tax=Nostoc sp. TaxID=1180 RepID=UPI002FF6B2FC